MAVWSQVLSVISELVYQTFFHFHANCKGKEGLVLTSLFFFSLMEILNSHYITLAVRICGYIKTEP